MKGFFIPGVENRYNTKETKEAMLGPEKKKIDSAQEKLKSYEQENKAWQILNKKMNNLNSIAKELSSLNSPFNQMGGFSSDDNILTLSTQIAAKKGEYQIDVNKIASADIFLSKDFKTNEIEIPKGNYTFLIGKKEIKIKNDGNINLLIADINKNGKDFLTAKIVKSDLKGNSKLILESLQKGKENQLILKDKAFELAQQIEMLGEFQTNFIPVLEKTVKEQMSKQNNINFAENMLILNPLSELSIRIPEDILITKKTKIKFSIKYEDSDIQEKNNKIIFKPGETSFQDAKVESEESIVDFESNENKQLEEKTYISINLLKLYGKENLFEPDLINVSSQFEEMQIEIGNKLSDLEELVFENKINSKAIIIKNIEIYDPRNREGYLPLNAKSFAENARIKLDGVDIERNTNQIKDLIPNITLTLKNISEKTVTAKVKPDYEGIKNALTQFLIAYNEVAAQLNITSANQQISENQESDIIEEAATGSILTEKEKEEAYKNLGTLRTELFLKNIILQLNDIMFKPYQTDDPNISMINQIGVYTNSISSTGNLSRYLKLKYEKFKELIENNSLAIKELFSQDTNGDKIIDSGLAKEISDYLTPFIRFGGVIKNRIKYSDTKVAKQKETVEDYKTKYIKKEKKVEGELNALDSALKKMQEQSKQLKSLNIQQNNN